MHLHRQLVCRKQQLHQQRKFTTYLGSNRRERPPSKCPRLHHALRPRQPRLAHQLGRSCICVPRAQIVLPPDALTKPGLQPKRRRTSHHHHPSSFSSVSESTAPERPCCPSHPARELRSTSALARGQRGESPSSPMLLRPEPSVYSPYRSIHCRGSYSRPYKLPDLLAL